MSIQLRLECDSAADAESLHRWLRREPMIREEGDVAWADSPDPAELGTLIDVLTLVLSSGFSVAQLALSLTEWRLSRPRPPDLTIVYEKPDGSIVRIEVGNAETLEHELRGLVQG